MVGLGLSSTVKPPPVIIMDYLFLTNFLMMLLKQYPNYVVELLLQLTCCVEGTSGDDSSSWLRAVLSC